MKKDKLSKHLFTGDKVVRTAISLSKEISDKYPNSSVSDHSEALVFMAKEVDNQIKDAAKPYYWAKLVSMMAILAIIFVPMWIIHTSGARWEFETITDLFEAADAGINMLVLLLGTLWFIYNLEERARRKKALSSISSLRELVHVIDVTQIYYSPSLNLSEASRTQGGQEVDLRYLFLCGRMVGVISNIAALFTRDESDEAIWRAVSEVESLANSVALKFTAKIEVVPLIKES